jgi:hypothetical protein
MSNYKIIVSDFCKILKTEDFSKKNSFQISLNNYVISIFCDEVTEGEYLSAYIDLGGMKSSSAGSLKNLLKLNFQMAFQATGLFCLHPTTGNIFYVFRYVFSSKSSGQGLLDNLIRCTTDTLIEVSKDLKSQ